MCHTSWWLIHQFSRSQIKGPFQGARRMSHRVMRSVWSDKDKMLAIGYYIQYGDYERLQMLCKLCSMMKPFLIWCLHANHGFLAARSNVFWSMFSCRCRSGSLSRKGTIIRVDYDSNIFDPSSNMASQMKLDYLNAIEKTQMTLCMTMSTVLCS
jgi:hypothetical protein